jgi:rifampin ADP-ribosylating transferase
MNFDPSNRVVKFCTEGMDLEGQGNPIAARALFIQAWNEASNDFEKFIAAHYVARHQDTVSEKLRWDEMALYFALRTETQSTNGALPSLYLNIAKCHEDLGDMIKAKAIYEIAWSLVRSLPDDGYGNMIRAGVKAGLERVTN